MNRRAKNYLPDEGKNDIGGAGDGHRSGLFSLQCHRQKNLAGETEDGQENHQVSIVTACGKAQLTQHPRTQQRLHYGECTEC